MNELEVYQEWLEHQGIDEQTKTELLSITDSPKDIEDRFFKYLEFGTGGMRGVLGAGTNRINRYTVRRATQGLADYIAKVGADAKNKGVVIAYDSRHQSAFLAEETACTLVANGIRVYLFDHLRPTPELSFAVRYLKAQAGIVVTASHNPPEYNGYKVYWEDGGQIASDIAAQVIAEVNKLSTFEGIHYISREDAEKSGFLQMIGNELDQIYMERLEKVSLNSDVVRDMSTSFSIVYTPLHGAGRMLVPETLKRIGFTQVHIVQEQDVPDPNFSTVKSPNPEEKEAFQMALSLAQEKKADIVVATDPDCDRVGIAARDKTGEYVFLTGNQTGALLVEYLLSVKAQNGTLSSSDTVFTTIVTSELGSAVARKYGIDTILTLTGFKYIAEQIRLFEEQGGRQFVFGYEESYGYLADSFVRDKDAVMSTMLICEMGAFYKKQGKSLIDVLNDLYAEHGFYQEGLESRTLKGIDGLERIQAIMNDWRTNSPVTIAGSSIVEIRDYAKQIALDTKSGIETTLSLPKENVLQYCLEDGSWFCLRPSGTEPKLKIYFSIKGQSQAESIQRMDQIKAQVLRRVDEISLG